MNLIKNSFKALKYRPKSNEKKLTIFLESSEIVNNQNEKTPAIKIIVQDTGNGISQNDMDQIFSPLYSQHSKNEDDVHLGLGLVIVKNVVEEHSGQVFVSSKEGEGTTFEVKLPTI